MVKAVLEEAAHTIDRFDAEVLLAHIFHQSRTWLLAHGEEAVTSAQHRRYRSLVVRRARAEPVAYLIGETSFYAKPFFTDPRALIPRPETEDLVTRGLDMVRMHPETWAVWDVGTGSGVIAVSLACCEPRLVVLASDISSDAIRLARKNARRHHARIKYIHANLLDESVKQALIRAGRSHLLMVANLPYVPFSEKKGLMSDVRDYEPHQALFAPQRGTGTILRWLKQIARWQSGLAWIILLECDPSHATKIHRQAKNFFPQAKVQILKDIYHRNRFVEIQSAALMKEAIGS